MDNADKIEENALSQEFTHKEVKLFLGDDLKFSKGSKAVTYDLEEEYAATKKNRQFTVWALLFICFFIVGIGTFIAVKSIIKSNNQISINIDSFDDLNLKTLLSSSSRVKNAKDTAEKKLHNLEVSQESELKRAYQKRDSDLFTLKSMEPVATKESVELRRKEIYAEYESQVKKIKEYYEPLLASAKEDIELFQNQESNYDSQKLKKAKEEEAAIDSTQQLHDIEMAMSTDRYESEIKRLQEELIAVQNAAAINQQKAVEEVRAVYQAKINQLDPKAREENKTQDKIILDTGIKNQTPISNTWNKIDVLNFSPQKYTSVSENPEQEFVDAINKSNQELEEIKTIGGRFKPIPMENSIKDYVPAMIIQTYDIVNALAESEAELQKKLDIAREESASKDEFIENFVNETSADGTILRAADGHTTAYVKEDKRNLMENGSVKAQIFKGSKVLGEITLSKYENLYLVTVPAPSDDSKKSQNVYIPQTGDRFKFVTKD